MLRRRGRPIMRTAAIVGTASAVGGTVSHHQQQRYAEKDAQAAGAEQQYAEPQPQYAPPPPPPPAAAADPTEELTKLAQLHSQGILTDEEFSAKKAQIRARVRRVHRAQRERRPTGGALRARRHRARGLELSISSASRPLRSISRVRGGIRSRTAGSARSGRCRSRSGSTWRSKGSRTRRKKRRTRSAISTRLRRGDGHARPSRPRRVRHLDGVAGWRAVVYPEGSDVPSDAPLPLALAHVVGRESPLYTLLLGIGLLGLVASFHGILLAAGRATMALGGGAYLPRRLARVHEARNAAPCAGGEPRRRAPRGIATGRTAEIITLSCFGAWCST